MSDPLPQSDYLYEAIMRMVNSHAADLALCCHASTPELFFWPAPEPATTFSAVLSCQRCNYAAVAYDCTHRPANPIGVARHLIALWNRQKNGGCP